MPFKTKEEKREYMRAYMRKRREETGGEVQQVVKAKSQGFELSLDLIDPSHELVRDIDGFAVTELRESIKVSGVLQPILVRPKGERYEIVFGNHRYYAAKGAGLTKIPVQIRNINDDDALLLAVTENVQRLDMNPLKQGELFDRLVQKGYSVFVLAQRLGKTETYVKGRIDIYKKLHPELKNEIGKRLTLTSAMCLCKLAPNQQLKVFQEVETKRESLENSFRPPTYSGFGGGGVVYPSDKCTCPKCGSKHWKGTDSTVCAEN